MLPSLLQLPLGTPSAPRTQGLLEEDEDEMLQRAILLSLQHSNASSAESAEEPFAVMVMGGSKTADPAYYAALRNCSVFTVGDHPTADIKGDWTDPNLWKAAAARKPDAVVIDYGSDSWIKDSNVGTNLAQLLATTKAALLVSPPNQRTQSEWYDAMSPVSFFGDDAHAHMRRYRVTLLDTEPNVLFAFRHDFEEMELFPSQVMMLASECLRLVYEDRKGIADERRECYERKQLWLGKGLEWYDALQLQLSYLTKRVSAPKA
tara:strand:+ start:58 stop:843 length:786 start_codon:yes stop_codon:yes gene_type:complete